jgi:CRP/FNR family cyclic AMP-dependent transcriptional regulator
MDAEIAQDVAAFFKGYPQRVFKKGEIIIRAGETPPGILYIEQGKIAQYDIANDGRKIVVNIFQPPAFFPMAWAINDTPNAYYFEATSPASVRCAPSQEVVTFIRSQPNILFNLLSRVYRGTDGIVRRMAHSLGGKASTLLLFEVLVCCRRFGVAQTEKKYVLTMTDQELATHTGLSRETVNRELQLIKQAGLIELSYGKITILDIQKLEATVGNRL